MNDFLHYVILPFLLKGALTTLELTAIGMAGAVVLGIVLAVMRLSSHPWIRWPAGFYVWLVRGTPLLLQLIFLFDVMPKYGIKFSPFLTAAIGFIVNEAAYEAEIFRGGITSVGRDQRLAAASLGMSDALTLRRVLIPQALRSILPTLGNQAAGMLKNTSLASVIAVDELTLRSEQIASANFKFVTLFTAAGFLYLIMTTLVAIVQRWLEGLVSLDRPRPRSSRRMAFCRPRRVDRDLADATVRSPETSRAVALVPMRRGDTSGDPQFIRCSGIGKSYDARPVLNGVDLTIGEGEVVVLMGPSGSGKSTFLRLVNHLEGLDQGEILIGGRYVGYAMKNGKLVPVRRLAKARADAGVAMVFQHFNLFQHRTALENVIEAPVRVHHRPVEEATAEAVALLTDLGLGEHLHSMPHALSGGQQQRVAIARALATKPRVLLLDEPTSALDPELVGEVLNTMRSLAHSGITMVIATHERDFAREVADRVVFMDGGVVVEEGTPSSVLDDPQHARTQKFLRQLSRSVEV